MKRITSSILCAILIISVAFTVFADDVSSVITETWTSARGQVENVVNNVVFPAMDVILAIMFFVKVGMCYFDYRKRGQLDLSAPVIIFVCLIFTLTAPLYIWKII